MRLYLNGNNSALNAVVALQVYLPIEASQSSKATRNLRQLTAQFGDGYQQRAPDGINAITLQYNLTYKDRTKDIIEALVNFFEGTDSPNPNPLFQRNATEAFFWTPPPPMDNVPLLFTYKDLSYEYGDGNMGTLSVTLTQVFEP